MAQVKPTYEEVTEFSDIAEKLVQKYPDLYSHIDSNIIKCLAINNKERPDSRKLWEIKALPEYALPDCPYAYYAIIYLHDWSEMTEKIRNRLIATILYAIPDEEGKVRPFDYRNFGPMVRTLGIDYLEDEEGPDPLTEDVEWTV